MKTVSKILKLLCLSLLLFSCTKDIEPVQEKPPVDDGSIRFGSMTIDDADFLTRGSSHTPDKDSEGDIGANPILSMSMFCYNTEELNFGADATPTAHTPNWMYDTKISRNITTVLTPWKSETTAFWIPQSKHSFFAFAPDEAPRSLVSEVNKNGAPSLTYAIPRSGEFNKIANYIDILYASHLNVLDTDFIDFEASPITVKAVPMVFKHALSQITFSVRIKEGVTLKDNEQVRIHGLLLANIYANGVLEFQENTTGTLPDYTQNMGRENNYTDIKWILDPVQNNNARKWSDTEGTGELSHLRGIFLNNTSASPAMINIIQKEAPLFMIPQPLAEVSLTANATPIDPTTNHQPIVTLAYHHIKPVLDAEGNPVIENDVPLTVDRILEETVNLPKAWEAGASYHYILHLNPADGDRPLSIEATMTDWTNKPVDDNIHGGYFTVVKRSYGWSDRTVADTGGDIIEIPFTTDYKEDEISVNVRNSTGGVADGGVTLDYAQKRIIYNINFDGLKAVNDMINVKVGKKVIKIMVNIALGDNMHLELSETGIYENLIVSAKKDFTLTITGANSCEISTQKSPKLSGDLIMAGSSESKITVTALEGESSIVVPMSFTPNTSVSGTIKFTVVSTYGNRMEITAIFNILRFLTINDKTENYEYRPTEAEIKTGYSTEVLNYVGSEDVIHNLSELPNWLTVEKTGSGRTGSMKFAYNTNTALYSDAKSFVVTLSCSELTRTITLHAPSIRYLTLNEKALDLSYSPSSAQVIAGHTTEAIRYDGSNNIADNLSSLPTWLRVTETGGGKSGTLSFTYSDDTALYSIAKSFVVTLSCSGVTRTITLVAPIVKFLTLDNVDNNITIQKTKEQVLAGDNKQSVNYAGSGNVSVSLGAVPAWLSIQKTGSGKTGTLNFTISADARKYVNARSHTVRLTCADITRTITIIPPPFAFLTINGDTKNLTYRATESEIVAGYPKIVINYEGSSEVGVTWYKNLNNTVQVNKSPDRLSGTVTITLSNNVYFYSSSANYTKIRISCGRLDRNVTIHFPAISGTSVGDTYPRHATGVNSIGVIVKVPDRDGAGLLLLDMVGEDNVFKAMAHCDAVGGYVPGFASIFNMGDWPNLRHPLLPGLRYWTSYEIQSGWWHTWSYKDQDYWRRAKAEEELPYRCVRDYTH